MIKKENKLPKQIIVIGLILSVPFFFLWLIIREKLSKDPSGSLQYGFEAIIIISILFFILGIFITFKYKQWFKKYWFIILLQELISAGLFTMFNGIEFIKYFLASLIK